MAPSRAVAEKLSARQNFARFLFTGLVLAALVLLWQDRPVRMEALRLTAPVRLRIIDAAEPAAPAPAFNPDAGLSSRELMERWEPLIANAAKRFKMPAAWIRNVMRSESGGRTFLNGQPITSAKGALGLMQVEPGTYAEMAARYQLGDDPSNPADNILAGAAYLSWLHSRYGFPAMFAAYNAGPGHLEDHLNHGAPLPAETRAYVAGITRALGAQWLVHTVKITLTAPNGHKLKLDPASVRGVRPALPGEYAPGVATVIDLGDAHQGVRESPETVAALVAPPSHGA